MYGRYIVLSADGVFMCTCTTMLPQARERERVNEHNVSQLQSTVDRMLNEAKQRLKTHSSERKQLVDAKVRKESRSVKL